MKPQTIGIVVSHGFHVRNIVYSRLYSALTESFQVVLILPIGIRVPVEDQWILKGAIVEYVEIKKHRMENIFLFLRKNVFAGRNRTQTFNLITEAERKKHPIIYPISSIANSFFGRLPFVASLWSRVEAFFIAGHEFEDLLRAFNPKLVVLANYGTEAFEVRLLRATRKHKIPSLAIVPSWDNFSSKGVIGEDPSCLVVWNRIMADEAVDLYNFRSDRIYNFGALQFDSYALEVSEEEESLILDRLGISRSSPWLLIGTITPKYFSKSIEIIQIINDAIEENQLPRNLQIVVRLHPQVIDDNVFGDNLQPYLDLAERYSRIHLSIPAVLSWGSISPPSPDDVQELKVLLKGASVSIMPATTLAIDACALGSPVIGIGFDGYEKFPYHKSVRRTFDFTHYKRLVDCGGVRIAESSEELIFEISSYLLDRKRDLDGRSSVISSHLGLLDGNAWVRIFNHIKNKIDCRL